MTRLLRVCSQPLFQRMEDPVIEAGVLPRAKNRSKAQLVVMSSERGEKIKMKVQDRESEQS